MGLTVWPWLRKWTISSGVGFVPVKLSWIGQGVNIIEMLLLLQFVALAFGRLTYLFSGRVAMGDRRHFSFTNIKRKRYADH